jgi:hypothetical protein
MEQIFVLIPGIGEKETVEQFCDVLCDYARHFGDEQYHKLAQTCDTWVKKFGKDTTISSLDDEIVKDLLDEKTGLVLRLGEKINFEKSGNKMLALNPEIPSSIAIYEKIYATTEIIDQEFLSILEEFSKIDRKLLKLAWEQVLSSSHILLKLLSTPAVQTLDEWSFYKIISLALCSPV